MKKSYLKCYFLLYAILIHSVSYMISHGGNSEEKTSSSKILPIILMKESNVLEVTNNVSLEHVFCFWEKINFSGESGLHELYFCAADSKSKRRKIKKARQNVEEKSLVKPLVSANCLFEKPRVDLKNFFSKMPRCLKEPEPTISAIFQMKEKITKEEDSENNFEWLSCGPTGENKLYRFGYQIWLKSKKLNPNTRLQPPLTKSMALPNENIIDYEIYRFCYNHSMQEVLYAKYRILSPSLLSNENLKEESEKTYPINFLKYDNTMLDFQNIENLYKEMNHLDTLNDSTLGDDPKNIPTTPNLLHYRMEKLIPEEDLAFVLWKKPLFHGVNGKLMHKKLSNLWKEINEIIQSRAKSANLEFDIYIGTFNILNENDEKESTKSVNETKIIPQTWIKIVQIQIIKPEYEIDINEGIAIIVNNHMNDDLERKIISKYCGSKDTNEYHPSNKPLTSESDTSHSQKEPVTSEQEKQTYSYIRTCLVTDEIQNLFGLNLKIRKPIVLF